MDVSLLLRKSSANNFVPSGENVPGNANMPSPNTGRVSPLSRSRTQTSMSVGLRAFAAYAKRVPSGAQAALPT